MFSVRIRGTLSAAAMVIFGLLTPDLVWPQSFVAKYARSKTAQFDKYNQHIQRTRLLERIAADLSDVFSLPEQVILTVAECGQSNAYYNRQRRVIVMCYELIREITDGIKRDFASKSSQNEISASISGGINFILMHELGHALIHLLDLPVLGKEEDAADTIGAFFLLRAGEKAPFALAGAMWFFRAKTLFYTRAHFSDAHSIGPQRQSNLACWAFGKDPQKYQYLLRGGFLSPQRAVKCAAEYQQLDSSVRRLLGQNVSLP